MERPPIDWTWLGRIAWADAMRVQERLRRQRLAGEVGDTLLLCEHFPVVTLGRHADPAHAGPAAALAAAGIARAAADRGGDVTYHGPGQLVGYTVFRPPGIRAHVEALGRALVALAARLGVAAEWRADPAGVWVGADKLAAVGLRVTRGVTTHGFAFNLDPRPDGFRLIVPCGLHAAGVTAIARQTGAAPPPHEVAPMAAEEVARAVGREAVARPAAALSDDG